MAYMGLTGRTTGLQQILRAPSNRAKATDFPTPGIDKIISREELRQTLATAESYNISADNITWMQTFLLVSGLGQ